MVVFDKLRHPNTLAVLTKMIPEFRIGWGDKEIYWIATTVAQEPYKFSPYLATQFGDCGGVMMHFDPDNVDSGEAPPREADAKLLFVNGEILVESVDSVGAQMYLSGRLVDSMMMPTVVNASVRCK